MAPVPPDKPHLLVLCRNITDMKDHECEFEGVWASFAAAYFPRFEVFLSTVDPVLKPGGWLAITEVDDLFGHEPLDPRWLAVVEEYYGRSLEESVYRFRSHDHVRQALFEHSWRIGLDGKVEDDEFCFAGPASPEILEAWKSRLSFMMPQFLERFAKRAKGFDSAFLQCLASREHRSRSHVWFILARSPDEGNNTG